MTEKYTIIVAKKGNEKDILPEHIADVQFLIKVEKGGKITKIPYSPVQSNPGVGLVRYINKNLPDLNYLVTGIALRFADNLTYGKNITFSPGTTIDEILVQLNSNPISSNETVLLKNTESINPKTESNDSSINNNIPKQEPKNKNNRGGISFFIIILILILLYYYINTPNANFTQDLNNIIGSINIK
ncbi:MAG: hypothetical protein KAR87_00415 [Candidatus Aenigmarchaeota archaeon]|nr:hypothetical protein [Candidatus Aenigmarchaeota archaeon]